MTIVTGNLLAHDAACIVPSWNMNVFPRWFLLPAFVSCPQTGARLRAAYRSVGRG